ncbi:major facilitator superfamily domain-containing protein, partial [Chytridium lagenaria]
QKAVTWRHWLLLILGSVLVVGNYYCYDTPASINVPLQEWLGSDYDLFQWQINLLYSVYSLPNIFLPLIGGLFVDKLGPTMMLLIFSFLVCFGQALFALGMTFKSFWLMVLGRLVFGLGGESLEVAQARITTDWFKGRGLAFALGLNLSFARISTALNDNISPWIVGKNSPPAAGWFGFGVCTLSVLCAVTIIYMDRPESRRAAGVAVSSQQRAKERVEQAKNEEERTGLICGLPVEDIGVEGMTSETLEGYESEEFDEEDDETLYCSQVTGLGLNFWLLSLATILLYGGVVPFFHICTDFFQKKMENGYANSRVMSIPDWISAVGSPSSGVFLDLYGYRGLFLPISAVFLVIAHSFFLFSSITPIVGMSVIGITYSMFAAALWPCVPYLVGPHQIATGYGLISVSLNLSLFAVPLAVAHIRNWSSAEDFSPALFFFMALGVVAFVLTVGLNVLDRVRGGSALNLRGEVVVPIVKHEVVDGNVVEEEEDSPPTRVVGDGVVIVTPHTIIHHHHHRRLSIATSPLHNHPHSHDDGAPCRCAETNGGLSPTRMGENTGFLDPNRGRSRSRGRSRAVSPVTRRVHYGAHSPSVSPARSRTEDS